MYASRPVSRGRSRCRPRGRMLGRRKSRRRPGVRRWSRCRRLDGSGLVAVRSGRRWSPSDRCRGSPQEHHRVPAGGALRDLRGDAALFQPSTPLAVEALLRAEDAVGRGDLEAASALIESVFRGSAARRRGLVPGQQRRHRGLEPRASRGLLRSAHARAGRPARRATCDGNPHHDGGGGPLRTGTASRVSRTGGRDGGPRPRP